MQCIQVGLRVNRPTYDLKASEETGMDQKYFKLLLTRIPRKIAAAVLLLGYLILPTPGWLAPIVHAETPPVAPQSTDCHCAIFMPVIQQPGSSAAGLTSEQKAENDFIASVTNGEVNTLRGAYVAGTLALMIEQQPGGEPNYISLDPNRATEYTPATRFGVIGLLAHNSLAGKYFDDLVLGTKITIVYGDGHTRRYEVAQVAQYQSVVGTSDYIDLASGEKVSGSELFLQMYTGDDHVTFQTCIAKDGNPSWGRLFVIAVPVS